MTKEQQDAVFVKWNQERTAKASGASKSFPTPRRANMHDVETYVDLDSIIDYAVCKHEVDYGESNEGGRDSDNCGTELLAYMAGQKSSSGDTGQVLASKQA
jgi:hypothetical protein